MLKRSLSIMLTFSILMSLFVVAPAVSNAADGLEPSTGPFGPNVYVFDQNTPASEVQRITAEVFKRQEASEFGNDRYALFFKPGTYQTDIRVGFYTHVAGLGQSPDDVTIKGDVTVDALWWNQPVGNATKNFWRSAENFTIEPTSASNKWAVAQAVPFRRMHVKGDLKLHDGGWASGGYMADSKVDGRVEAGGQQQWFSRNSVMNDWSGGQWNNVFLGDNFGTAPANTWPATPNTIVNQTPINREKPFLTVDGSGAFQVFVPGLQSNTKGTSWSGGASQGKSIPLDQFYVASPDKSDAATINAALAAGKNLLLTPGIYHLNDTIRVTRPDTVVLGIGFATLMPHNGVVALSVDDVDGVTIAGLLFDAGSESSPALMQVGPLGSSKDHSANPTLLQDLFFRVGGGPVVGRADTSIKINSNNVIGDHFWVWRADHGTDVKWNLNTTTNGLVVNGNDVTIYGLFVEHFHEYQTLWNGDRGRMYFYQSEIPYDVPDQDSWMSSNGTVKGFASYKVAESVKSHDAWGVGIYSFFRDADNVKLESAIEIPDTPNVKIHNATSVFLSGFGEITHIVNNIGNAVKKGSIRATFTEYTPRTPVSITPLTMATITGRAPVLPAGVTQVFGDGTTKNVPVTWETIDPSKYTSVGSFPVKGTVGASTNEALAQVTVAQAPNVAVTSIKVTGAGNASSIKEKRGTLQMSAGVMPSNADQTTVTWSVVNTNGKDTDKATIDATGLLKAANDGIVKVIATAKDGTDVKGEALITISGQIVKVSTITVTGAGGANSITTKGGTLQMTAAVAPANADEPTITWSVENGIGKATIDAAGLLKPQSDGTVNVIATSKDGSGVVGKQTINIIGQALTLNNGWSWVRESPVNWAIEPTNANVMKLTTMDGRWASGSYPNNILLKNPGTTDFAISTKLKFDATQGFEWAGLIVYQDDGNFISLGRQANGNNPGAAKQIRFSQVKGGSQSDKNDTDPVSGDIYLKIEKIGTTYNGYYSSNGTDWTQATDMTTQKVVTFTGVTLTNPKVGIFVRKLATNNTPPAKLAEFSNFTLTDIIVPYWNPVTSISVTGAGGSSVITADKGTLQMSAGVMPGTADNKAVLWSVVNTDGSTTDKATISVGGLLTAVKNGKLKVVATATDGSGVTGSATIDISGQPEAVASITVTGAGGANAITNKGGKLLMSADVQPANANNKTVSWSVYNTDGTQTDKATISTVGLVTALKDGQVKVVASATDGSSVTGSATIDISGQIVQVASIVVTGSGGASAITMKSGTLQMSADVLPATATDKTFTWSVVNADGTATDKATISSGGLLTAVKDGAVKVIATAHDSSGVKGEANITISGQIENVTAATLIGPNAVYQQQQFDLTVGVSSLLSSFTTLDVILNYDPNLLEFDTITNSDGTFSLTDVALSSLRNHFNVLGTAIKADKGQIRIIMASEGNDTAISTIGNLLTIHAKTKAGVAAGETTVSLSDFMVSLAGSGTLVTGVSLSIQIKDVDKVDLNAAIIVAQNRHDAATEGNNIGQYPTGSKARLQTAINNAKAVRDNATSTQSEVADALSALNAALTTFTNSVYTDPGTVVDKAALSKAITATQSKYDGGTEGTKVGQYPAAARAALQAAISSANAVFNSSAATQTQVNTATTNVNTALQTFLTKIVTLVPGQTSVTINDLSVISKYYGMKSTDANWSEIEAADIFNNGKIDIQVLAAVARMLLDNWLLDN